MPGVFEQFGFHFQYPDNWSVEYHGPAGPRESCGKAQDLAVDVLAGVDQKDAGPAGGGQGGQVVVSSPHTAFWQLSRHPAGTDLEPLFDEALSALRAEYHSIEVEPHDETLAGFQLSGYDVSFFCLDLTNSCWLRGLQTPPATYLLLCQAEDREFAEVCPVFHAMLVSALSRAF